jgi:hypothetical protein
MFGITSETRVFLKTGYIDGRLGYEGLRGLVSKALNTDVRSGLFAAIGAPTGLNSFGITRAAENTCPSCLTWRHAANRSSRGGRRRALPSLSL